MLLFIYIHTHIYLHIYIRIYKINYFNQVTAAIIKTPIGILTFK